MTGASVAIVAIVATLLLCGLIAALVACGMEFTHWLGRITCWSAAAFLAALLVFSLVVMVTASSLK